YGRCLSAGRWRRGWRLRCGKRISDASKKRDLQRFFEASLIARRPREPHRRFGVAWHAPVAAGRKADRADLRAVGQTRSLELIGEESLQEHLEPASYFVC